MNEREAAAKQPKPTSPLAEAILAIRVPSDISGIVMSPSERRWYLKGRRDAADYIRSAAAALAAEREGDLREQCRMLEQEAAARDPETTKLYERVGELQAENERLKQRLLTAAGDDLCRLTQEEIKAMSAGTVKIPPKEEFLASCERFHTQVAGEAGVMTNCLTLAQLVAENEKLRDDNNNLRGVADHWRGEAVKEATAKAHLVSQNADLQRRLGEAEATAKDLPDTPGFWFRNGEMWVNWNFVNSTDGKLFALDRLSDNGHFVKRHLTADAPRGNWFKAGDFTALRLANDKLRGLVERAKNIMQFHSGRCPLNPTSNFSGHEEHLSEYRNVIKEITAALAEPKEHPDAH